MLVAAGFLDNLVLEAEGRRILVKGRTTKELVLAEETENTEVYRERLRTTVVKGGEKLGQWGGAKVYHQRSLASVNVRVNCSGEVSQRQAGSRLGG